MFFLAWRGNGVIALGALVVMCIPCIAVIGNKYQSVGALIGGLLGIVGGFICVRYGRRWNRQQTEHSMYWVPLQGWGYIIFALAILEIATGSAGLYKVLAGQR